ncbi:hypothetical protein [Pyrococcus abyssi]|uniref:Uncharacterized protein n=1 Tax=Pyrococcus abyssi (strain GE5 / Orsay) TaxID=272844 RepID=G8ZHF0_PYRAB|nr:hypothetical protein [Pyrococcus abyssi]CCE70787.1 TPA: hypothetical protein PAB1489.1n [Pyrococcus abyssi GE5]
MREELNLAVSLIEALIIGWFSYAFSYQNYLLYKWHRGMVLPSKTPFVLIGVIAALIFLGWKYRETIRNLKFQANKG